ncbi:MAG: helix-turn-helix domain-containing protein [Candidatus Omnitrophica bacterium]|nr:helix-turn-helix domain-containing protein [Candidatus Omnitrophota bacterium]
MAKNQTNETMERLQAYWQFHRKFDANISDLAKYVRVSRNTVYRWLNQQAQPKEKKLQLIQEWLDRKPTQTSHT